MSFMQRFKGDCAMSDNREAALEASAKFLTQLILRFGKLDCCFCQDFFVPNCVRLLFATRNGPVVVEFDKHGNGLYDVKKIHYSGYEEVLWVDGWIHEPIPEQVIEHFKKLFDGTL
ncbi:MAG: hypothetical protein ACKO37_09315 [Vampirovibrionales bacterium]